MAFAAKYVSRDDLPIGQKMALDAATKAMLERPYQPYSHFLVGAALLTQDGELISGTNFENASYGLTMCAERSTIFTANNKGKRMFHAIAVNAKGETFDCNDVTGPCGACRQVIYEAAQVSGKNLEVILSTSKMDKVAVTTIGDLLPLAFGPADLGVDLTKYRTPTHAAPTPWKSATCGTETAFSQLSPDHQQLLQQAEAAMRDRSYNPYSKHRVGAALLEQGPGGRIIANANFENASYGLTECAERTATFYANALGKRMFEAIAVIGGGDTYDCTEVSGPCGACRQVIYEASHLSGKDLEVIMATTKMDKIVVAKISDLLPLAFGPRDLGVDLAKYRK